MRTALICYDGVLTADGGNGAAHEGKAIMLLEQYARGFLSSEAEAGKTGEEKVEQVVLAEAREHYLLAAGLPAGARPTMNGRRSCVASQTGWMVREVGDSAFWPTS